MVFLLDGSCDRPEDAQYSGNNRIFDKNSKLYLNLYALIIAHLKSGKSDGSEGLFSDHFIHGTHRFYVILSILYTSMLSHGFSPNSMILGTMIPIPKDKKKSLCNSGNYRAIALSSIFSKILDWVILIKEEMTLCSSNLQFGFKKGTSTTQCTFSMLETIDHYNFMKSNAFVLMLDASKAFDRVNYCKLFRELLKREMSPLVLRLFNFQFNSIQYSIQ